MRVEDVDDWERLTPIEFRFFKKAMDTLIFSGFIHPELYRSYLERNKPKPKLFAWGKGGVNDNQKADQGLSRSRSPVRR